MDALILVDIQNDFLPGGALAVKKGDEVVPVANRLMKHFPIVVATQDWHPPDHKSFASQHKGRMIGEIVELDGMDQVLWPDHCVQGTNGAAFAPALDRVRITKVFKKGTDPSIDSYSGFYDNGHKKSTGLGDWLTEQGVVRVTVLGLATDYCVRFTALDALHEGFQVRLVEDGCRGVELHPGDIAKALAQMRQAGVEITTSGAWVDEKGRG